MLILAMERIEFPFSCESACTNK